MSAQSLSIIHQQFTLSSFSASEWQYWLLFYLIPVLHGVLSTPHYLHFCALVCGIALLFGDKITENELVKAEVLLFEFCRHAGDLYGNHACLQCRYHKLRPQFILAGPKMLTMNVHQLCHLVYHVRNWGPLWCFSCFGFESVNGQLKKLFHGTRDMSEQVCSCMHGLSSLF